MPDLSNMLQPRLVSNQQAELVVSIDDLSPYTYIPVHRNTMLVISATSGTPTVTIAAPSGRYVRGAPLQDIVFQPSFGGAVEKVRDIIAFPNAPVINEQMTYHDGSIFAAANALVYSFDYDTGVQNWAIGGTGSGDREFDAAASGVCSDNSGSIFILDPGNNRVQEWDASTGDYIGETDPPSSGDITGTDVIYANGDYIWVSGSGNDYVYRFNRNTMAYLDRWLQNSLVTAGNMNVRGIFQSGGYLWYSNLAGGGGTTYPMARSDLDGANPVDIGDINETLWPIAQMGLVTAYNEHHIIDRQSLNPGFHIWDYSAENRLAFSPTDLGLRSYGPGEDADHFVLAFFVTSPSVGGQIQEWKRGGQPQAMMLDPIYSGPDGANISVVDGAVELELYRVLGPA